LLFAVMSLVMTNILPSWPMMLLLAVGITAAFVGLYWFLFVFWIGATPGERLAWLACSGAGNGMYGEEEDHARFR
jgi:hypothetical protein